MYLKKVSLLFIIFSLVLMPFKTYAALTITNGMDAVQVIGQYDYDGTPLFTKGGYNNTTDNFGMNNPQGMVIDPIHHRLFLSDANNNRVLVYNLDSSNNLTDKFADYVLGQTDFNKGDDSISQSRFFKPEGLAFDATNNILFVTDKGNNRILVFNLSGGITNGMNASYVLGQSDFTSNGSSRSQSAFNAPTDLAYDSVSSTLYVADTSNSRVLMFDLSSGITSGMNASHVLGQPDFDQCNGVVSSSYLVIPNGVVFDSTNKRLFVSDSGNNRVVVYNLAGSITNGMSASNVLGQADFNSIDSNITSQDRMFRPQGLSWDNNNKRLFVTDHYNNRILVFNLSSGIADGMSAINVLGQSDFTSSDTTTTQSGLKNPSYIIFNPSANSLYVSDAENNRVLIFSISTITNGQNASDEFGQGNDNYSAVYTKNAANNIPNISGLSFPAGTVLDPINHRLFICDYYNGRVVIFNLNSDNILTDYHPDYVIGQDNFYYTNDAVSQSALKSPTGIAYDQTSKLLFVADSSYNRILVFDLSSGITNGMNASYVLGQSDFTSRSYDIAQNTMSNVFGLSYDSTNKRLFATNPDANRVMVFDLSSGITNGMNASYVLGQSDFTSNSSGTTQSKLYAPNGVKIDTVHKRLFVADSGNNRVMVFDLSSGITNGMNASYVIGQTDFTSNSSDATQSKFNFPPSVDYDANDDSLFAVDNNNGRVMVFDLSSGITNGMNASYVIGQTDFTSNSTQLTKSKFIFPYNATFDATTGRLYVSDLMANRVMVFAPADGFTQSNSCSTVSHAISYNAYPTCGASACESGYTLSNGSCVANIKTNHGGGSYIPSTPKVNTSPQLINNSINSNVTNAQQMAISTSPDFSNASWVPYSETYKTTDKVIYVKFMSSDGGVSSVYKVEPQTTTVVGQNNNTPIVTTTPPSPTKYQFKRNLKLGMIGDDVKELQKFLNNNGYLITKTGPGSLGNETNKFGRLTQTALIKYQKDHHISPAIGYFGAVTRGVVNK